MSRNLPPNGTAPLDRPLVKGCSLSPAPPAIIIAKTLSIGVTPKCLATSAVVKYYTSLWDYIKLANRDKGAHISKPWGVFAPKGKNPIVPQRTGRLYQRLYQWSTSMGTKESFRPLLLHNLDESDLLNK
jgi:hypothetical protein